MINVEVLISKDMITLLSPLLNRKIALCYSLLLAVGQYSFAVPQKFGMTVDYATSVEINQPTTFIFNAGDDIQSVKIFVNGNSLGTSAIFKNKGDFTFTFKYGGTKKLSFSGMNAQNEVVSELKGDLAVVSTGESIRKNIVTLRTNDAQTWPSAATGNQLVPLTKPTLFNNFKFPPTPEEDNVNGRNSNAKLTAIGHPTKEESTLFIKDIQSYVVEISKKNKVPTSVIMGMAILESGYGFSRNAIMANNFFGLKWWKNSKNSVQMKGSPNVSGKAKVLRGDEDQYIFDETSRNDNWYRLFSSRKECITFLVEEVLLHKTGMWQKDYSAVARSYQKKITSGVAKKVAADAFVLELAQAGFSELEPKAYQERVLAVIARHNLEKLD